MKKTVLIVMMLALVLVLSACGCKHEIWLEADCETPKTCAECAKTEGEALGHSWEDATCESPKTCTACAKTEGEALGHSWAEADCETPKTCQTCDLTEGEALGHDWVDATTETPKTCTVCDKTEGERIITDERFVTANNQQLFGLWKAEISEYIPEFEMELSMYMYMDFYSDGTMSQKMELKDPEAFLKVMIQIAVDTTYAQLAAEGLDKAAADEAFMAEYGTTVEGYVTAAYSAMDMNELLSSMEAVSMVYYAQDDQLYSGISWDLEMTAQRYRLEDGVLYLYGEDAEEPMAYHRVEQTQE